MSTNRELILINISGPDKSGITAELTGILARHDADILDIGQADIHHTLSLGILFKTDSRRSGEILKELLFKTNDLNVKVSLSQSWDARLLRVRSRRYQELFQSRGLISRR